MQKMTSHHALVLAVAAVGLGASQSLAASYSWDNQGGDLKWSTAANWNGDVVPTSADTVLLTNGVPSGAVISLGASQAISELRIASYSNVPNLTIGNAADNLAGYTLTLTNVYRGDNNGNTQTIAAKIKLAADSTWNIVNGYNGSVAVSGDVTSDSSVAFIKEGNNTLTVSGGLKHTGSVRVLAGGLTLSSAGNTYAGTTTASGGTLTLNFNASSATSDIINSASGLVLGGVRGGGTLAVTGKDGASRSQTFASTSLNAGASTFSIANGSTGNTKSLVTLGNITRATGATVNFVQPTGSGSGNTTVGATNGYATGTSNAGSTGILGAYATVGGTDWATNNGTNVVAYTGYTTLAGASPTIANDAASNVNVTSGSTLDVGQAGGVTDINTLRVSDAAARTITIGSGNTLRLGATGGVLTPTGTGALTIGASGNAGTLTAGGADDTAGEIVFTNATAVTVNSAITNNGTGAVALTKSGAGNLTLAGTTSHTGGTHVNAGTLSLTAGSTDQLSNTSPIVVTGGTLALGTGTNQSTSGNVTIAGGTISGGTLTKTGGSIDARGGTISAQLSGSGGITKTTAGTLTLSNTTHNNFTGDTVITEGSIVGGGAANVNAISGNLIVGSSSGGPAASYANGSGRVAFATSRNVTVYSNGTVSFGSGAQNLSGTLDIIGGSVTGSQIYNQNATWNLTGGTLSTTFYVNAGTFNVLASPNSSVIGVATSVGSQTFNVNDGDAAFDLLYTGGLSGANSLSKNLAGTMVVTNNTGYTGATNINAGVLRVSTLAAGGSSSGIGAGAVAAANLKLGNGATLQYVGTGHTTDRLFTINGSSAGHGATLDASGTGAAVFNGSGNIAYGTTNQTRTLTLAGTSTADNTLGLTINNNGTQAVSVSKTGAGKWILSGSHGYTGATNITDGTLLIASGASLGNTTVTVNGAGAVLGGNGTIGGATTITDGTLSPGASIGTLTFGGDLTIDDTLLAELDADGAGTADKIAVAGTLTIGSGATLSLAVLNAVPLDDDAYIIATYGSLVGTFAENNVLNLPSGYEVVYGYDGQNQIAVVVPEPASLSLLALGALGMLRRRTRA